MSPHLKKLYGEAEDWGRSLMTFTCEVSLCIGPPEGLDHRPVVAKYTMGMEEEFLEDLLNEDSGLLVTLRTKELGVSGPHVHVWVVENEGYTVGFGDFTGSTSRKDFGCDFDPNRILDDYRTQDLDIWAAELSHFLFEPALRQWVSAHGEVGDDDGTVDPLKLLPADAVDDAGVLITTSSNHALPSTGIILSADRNGARVFLAKVEGATPKIVKSNAQPFTTTAQMTAWLEGDPCK